MPELDSIKANSPINHKTAENAVLDQRPLTYNVETDYLEKFLKKFGSPLDHALLTVFSESQDQVLPNRKMIL